MEGHISETRDGKLAWENRLVFPRASRGFSPVCPTLESGGSLNRGCTYTETVGPKAAGRGLAEYLVTSYTHTGLAEWVDRIQSGLVRLDGRPALPEEFLRPGQILTWERPPWEEPGVPLGCAVLFEDDGLVVVAKPSGLPTLAGADFQDHTLLALVRRRHPGASPIHRLGRFTSGLVLFSRTPASNDALCAAFRERRVEKVYRALIAGDPAQDAFTVEASIGPVPHVGLGTVHGASPQGRAALSDFRILERRGDACLAEVTIHSGRPHQIRIHAAACGHPLVGDPLYAPGGLPVPGTRALPGEGGYLLHAWRLAFMHPRTGRRLDIICQPPPGLRSFTP